MDTNATHATNTAITPEADRSRKLQNDNTPQQDSNNDDKNTEEVLVLDPNQPTLTQLGWFVSVTAKAKVGNVNGKKKTEVH